MLPNINVFKGLQVVRSPKNLEDCARNLRMGNCEYCSFRPKRGVSWLNCAKRVRMFLAEGGNIVYR